MSKEKQLCVKIIFILVDIWMFLQMRSVEFREKTSGDSHRNTMESLSQDKNGRRALLNKTNTWRFFTLSPSSTQKTWLYLYYGCQYDIPTTNLWHIGLLFLSQWVQVFGLYYCVGLTFSTIQVLDFLFSDPEGQVKWLKTNEV